MRAINSPIMNEPAGHYSHATVTGNLVFVSGQLPFPFGSAKLPDGIEAQTLQALRNVEAILLSAGSSLELLLNVQIFIPDVSLWSEVNRIYSEFMKGAKPARTIVPCGPLHHGALIEINAVAERQASEMSLTNA